MQPARARQRLVIRRRLLAVGLVVALASGHVVSGSASAGATSTTVVDNLTKLPEKVATLTGLLGSSGYGSQPNVDAVPFLGSDPTEGLAPFDTLDSAIASRFTASAFNALPGDGFTTIANDINTVRGQLSGTATLGTETITCGSSPCIGAQKVSDITSIRIPLTASGAPDDPGPDFALNLDALSFLTDGTAPKVTAKLNWNVKIDLVVDAGGARLESSSDPELSLKAELGLDNAKFKVRVGPVRMEATPIGTPGFSGTVTVDFPGSDLTQPTFGFKDASVDAHWDLKATTDSPLLGLASTFDIDWDLPSTTAGLGTPTALTVGFDNITLDASKFIGTSLSGATRGVREVVEPVYTATQPLVAPLPGFSTLKNFIGGDVSMLSIAEKMGASSDLRTAIDNIATLHKGLDIVAGGAGYPAGTIPLGSIQLLNAEVLKANGTPDLTKLQKIVDACDVGGVNPCKEAVDLFKQKVNDDGGGGNGGMDFQFPVLDHPETLAGLLLGRDDVDLFTFDTGDTLGFTQPVFIPLFNVFIFNVSIRGDLTARAHLKGGYDVRGIMDALSPDSDADELLNGLYLVDPGEPVVRLLSDVGFGAGFGFKGVAEAYIVGGPVVDVKLVVPPGQKLRPAFGTESIGCQLLKDPSATATFSVNMEAVLDPPVLPKLKHQLASATLLTKDDICGPDANPAALGAVNGSRLDVFPGSSPQRKPGVPSGVTDTIRAFAEYDDSGALENIVLSGNGGARQVFPATGITSVSYLSPSGDDRPVNFRALQTEGKPFPLPVSVTTNGGQDNVVLQLADSVLGFANLGGGADTFTGGNEVDRVFGGAGNDLISGGGNNDELFGGEDADQITGDDGVDLVQGDGGTDNVSGGSGDGNVVVGGADADTVISLDGADKLYGDEKVDLGVDDAGASTGGADRILTGGGADFVIGGAGDDEIHAVFDGTPADAVGVIVRGDGGEDKITTGDGDDQVWGGPDDDTITTWAGSDTVYGGSGGDTIDSGDDADTVYGDRGVDTCTQSSNELAAPAENGTDAGADVIVGGSGNDQLSGEAGTDDIFGVGGDDKVCGHAGGDLLHGDSGFDSVWGGTGADTLRGGNDDDRLLGGADADTANGDAGTDVVLGQAGNDTDVRGGSGDDHIEGGAGADTAHGDTGNDDIFGGSSPGYVIAGSTTADVGDSGDTLLSGGDGHDTVIGDNGDISRLGGTDVNDGAPARSITLREAATVGGPDSIVGDAGDDALFGGAGADTVEGGLGDDHIEGNDGNDALYGLSAVDPGSATARDQDDMIGGSSAVNPDPVKTDAGETVMVGDADRDVMIGDNGEIVRPVDGAGLWGTDPVTGGVLRSVILGDRTASASSLLLVSGGDYMQGGASLDRIYGEGGDDYLKGNEADDQVEGDQGGDRIEGNDGEDDLIGGSALQSAPGVGDPDGADRIAGGASADVILGDNAMVSRAATLSGTVDWDSVQNSWLGFTTRRSITLLDKRTPAGSRFGADTLSGGGGPDVIFGQDGADSLYGGPHDDYEEGNGGADTLAGDAVAPPTGDPRESAAELLDGPTGPDGQDDQIGGSSLVVSTDRTGAVTGQRDTADILIGDGAADTQLGDNGRVVRRIANGQYVTTFAQTQRNTVVRQGALAGDPPTALPARFDVGAAASAGVWGNDTLNGGAGDDLQLGQDGDDVLRGGAGDDDMYGELGNDDMAGESGEDAMLGDRGVIRNTLVTTPGTTFAISSVPAMSYTPYLAHPYDRRVEMSDDGDGAPLQSLGLTIGGRDLMRGGDDHDSVHGEAGDDLMNGDSGGDYLYGDDGVDVMWGGRGRICANPTDDLCNADRGVNDAYVDILFGGHGLKTDPVTGGADILDFRPRPGVDPQSWLDATDTEPTDAVAAHQHHQGIDWIYGGWDRDVLQADVADNGPNGGDRLLDWTGVYNLYTHCPAAYGGYNDVRLLSPALQSFLEQLAYATGAGTSLTDVRTAGTSGFDELALVYNNDIKANSGSSYPTTPGHFDQFSCTP